MGLEDQRVVVTGGSGLVGRAICKKLEEAGFLVLKPTHAELDLLDSKETFAYFKSIRPSILVAAAAKVGGIMANINDPVKFLVENTNIQTNTFLAAASAGVERIVFLGSSCIYPRESPQPMREEFLHTGPLEPTNESYAIAKLAGIQLLRALEQERGIQQITLIPSNIYGPGDSFNEFKSHVASALIRKFVDAVENRKELVEVWGSGLARRELLHSEDLADATEFVISNRVSGGILNVGTGKDISIAELARLIADLAGFRGEIQFDRSKPDGMPRKMVEISKLSQLGWTARIGLRDGLRRLMAEYRSLNYQRT